MRSILERVLSSFFPYYLGVVIFTLTSNAFAQYVSGDSPKEAIDISDRVEDVHSFGVPGAIRHGISAAAGINTTQNHATMDFMYSMEVDVIGKQIGFGGIDANIGGTYDLEEGSLTPFIDACFYALHWLCVGARYTHNDGTGMLLKTEVNLFRGWNTYFSVILGKEDAFWIDDFDMTNDRRINLGMKIPIGQASRVSRPVRAHVTLPKPQDKPFQKKLKENGDSIRRNAPELVDQVVLYYISDAVDKLFLMLMPRLYADSELQLPVKYEADGETLMSPEDTYTSLTPDEKREIAEKKDLFKIKTHLMENPDQGFYFFDSLYHESLEQLFAISTNDEGLGKELAIEAERLIFEEVAQPFNYLFSQRRKNFNLRGYSENALLKFAHHLDVQPVDDIYKKASVEAFRQVLEIIDYRTQLAKNEWGDRRGGWFANHGIRVWMPLNLGLRVEQYDGQVEQAEVLGTLVGRPFTDANKVTYIVNEAFYDEALASIHTTEYYHVVMIHDFRDFNNEKTADSVGWNMVAKGYMDTFTNSIYELIQGDRQVLPEFHLFLDEHFFRTAKSERIVDYMENLSKLKEVNLDNPTLQASLDESAQDLDVAMNELLKQPGWDKKRIEKLIKVNVNITNPASQDFNIGLIYNDGVMIDHRKIFFKDIFEEYPEIGSAIYTGQGVGEHYAGAGWEDRAIKFEGADLIHLKDETRALFLSQGQKGFLPFIPAAVGPEDVPYYLKERTPEKYPRSFAGLQERLENMRANGFNTPVTQVMNRTGYDQKSASVFKAAMYNLALPGGIIVAPDSIWSDEQWMSLLLSVALRGGVVMAVSPSTDNAPAAGAPTLALIHKTMTAGLMSAHYLADELEHSGGKLKIGLFNSRTHAQDILEKVDEIAKNIGNNPEIDEIFNFHPEAIAMVHTKLAELRAYYEANPQVKVNSDRVPKIHAKIHFFASQSARKVLELPEISDLLERYLNVRAIQTQGGDASLVGLTPENLLYNGTLLPAMGELLAGMTEEEAHTFSGMLTGGSHNQNPRSMYMDGEVIIAVAGEESVLAIPDVVFLAYSTFYPTSPQELNKYLHEPTGLMQWLVRNASELF